MANIEHAAAITAAYLGNNTIAADQVPAVIQIVHTALNQLGGSTEPTAAARPHPAVSIRKSIQPDAIVCLDCGFCGKMIRRHLTTAHDLSVEQYRERWGLALDYPLVAPNYAAKRSQLAKDIGLGTATARGRRRR